MLHLMATKALVAVLCLALAAVTMAGGQGGGTGTRCQDNTDCNRNFYCFKADCTSVNGECRVTPNNCPFNYDPVCGCDDQTYGNACTAAAAGVNVKSKGECVRLCQCSSECRVGEFCSKAVRGCRTQGVCTAAPQQSTCRPEFQAVCGCDGQTYAGTCFANVNRTSVAYAGGCVLFDQCPGPDTTCQNNQDCPRGDFCSKNTGQCNQWWARGTCEPVVQICPRIFVPVCGCNGVTYPNECEAHAQRVNVAYVGQCQFPRPSDVAADAK